MRITSATLIASLASVVLSIRTKSMLRSTGNLGDFDPVTLSSIPTLSGLDSYTGVAFDPTTTQFSVDSGSQAQTLNTQYQTAQATAPVLTLNPVTDYGMSSTIFGPPSTSFSAPLNEFIPSDFEVIPCSPTGNSDGCLKGTSAYNLDVSVGKFSR